MVLRDSFPAIDAKEFEVMEKHGGFVFPAAYRAFLLKTNGGRPSPNRFKISGRTGPYSEGQISWFFGIHDGGANNFRGEFPRYRIWDQRMPDSLIPIGGDDFGNKICLGVSGDQLGKVYFWDHEEETDPASFDNCYLIEDSFEQFVEGLY